MSVNRRDEIRTLFQLTPQQVIDRAGERLIVCEDIDVLHQRMASDIADVLRRDDTVSLILPVGPTGQYPLLAETLNRENVLLEKHWLFFMDEYCDERGQAVDESHPLSFKAAAESLFFERLTVPVDRARVIFPDEHNIAALADQIDALGGIDVCFGGIGIHGHVAFNEPEPGVRDSTCRKVRLNDFTVTINAVRAGVGGNLEGFPREAYTLGMRQILNAGQIRLYCRNGIGFDWANTVLRLALFGQPGDDYPVTHIRDRDHVIITDRDTLASPRHML